MPTFLQFLNFGCGVHGQNVLSVRPLKIVRNHPKQQGTIDEIENILHFTKYFFYHYIWIHRPSVGRFLCVISTIGFQHTI